MLSVVTLARNRNRMLRSMLTGLSRQDTSSFEVIVVAAGGDEDPATVVAEFPDIDVLIRSVSAPDERIPYSRARNTGARFARGDHLIFCDADTIPSPGFVRSTASALAHVDAVVSGDVLYLPPMDVGTCSFDELAAAARPHPHRHPAPRSGVDMSAPHSLIWGLCMGMRTSTFVRLGGFDESYGGYAGEDTDFTRTARSSGVPAGIVADAIVLHQHHDSFDPPVQQFRATLANARHFFEKWGEWPMRGWLDAFSDMGLIHFDSDDMTVVRDPTDDEIEASRRTVAAPFRSPTTDPPSTDRSTADRSTTEKNR